MSGWCEYEGTLIGWALIQDNCPPGEHCDPPVGNPPFSGAITFTLCVPNGAP